MTILKSYLQAPSTAITVHLLGAGGTGSMLLTHLARINSALHAIDGRMLHVTVWDPDTISRANLGRQMFSPADLGRNKAQVLVERLNAFFGLNWEAVSHRFDHDKAMLANVVISCTDTKTSRLQLHTAYNKITSEYYKQQHVQNYFWIDCGNGVDRGNMIVASHYYNWPTVIEYNGWSNEEDQSTPSCSVADAIAKQDLFINSWIANLAGTWLWQFLHKKQIDYRGVFVNIADMRMRKIPIDNKTLTHETKVQIHQDRQRGNRNKPKSKARKKAA